MINPGPENSRKLGLSFAVWNLDSLPARDYARIPLIESFQSIFDFDIFGVCESFLNNTTPNEDIFIQGFSADPFRADKPINIRNGGVCLYFKEHLPIKERKDLEIIPETVVAEINLNRKKVFFVLSYCRPNLSSAEYNLYTKSLENIYESIVKEKPSITILAGDFNARSPIFWENDIENQEGRSFSNFLMSNNLDELLNEPTHIRNDGSQSCIDLSCTDQSNIFLESGVLPSLDPHSKHNIIHGSLSLFSPCPPPYKRKVWDFRSAKTNLIQTEISNTAWEVLFRGLNPNEMTRIFTDKLFSIFTRHIKNKIITCNDKDAPWITPAVKNAIRRNNRVYRKWVKRGRNEDCHEHVRVTQNLTNKLIREAKRSYLEKLGQKLSDPTTGQKTFWTAFKRLSNKKKSQTFLLFTKMVDTSPTFIISLISLMNTLLNNVQLLTMEVFYQISFLKRKNLYFILLYQKIN